MEKTELTLGQVKQVAAVAATQAIGEVRQEIRDALRDELPAFVKSESSRAVPDDTLKFRRVYLRQAPSAPSKPESNYTQVIFACADWKRDRGECLGTAWMYMPGTQERLLIEQYEQECSVMRMDKAQPRAEFDICNRLLKPGKSIWTDFKSVKGLLEAVVARQAAKGWKLQIPELKQQLALVDLT